MNIANITEFVGQIMITIPREHTAKQIVEDRSKLDEYIQSFLEDHYNRTTVTSLGDVIITITNKKVFEHALSSANFFISLF